MTDPMIPVSLAKALADRLRVFAKLHAYHREVGDTEVNLPLDDLCNQADRAALDDFDHHLKIMAGERPLPMD